MQIEYSNKNHLTLKVFELQCLKPLNVIIKDTLPGVSQIDFYRIDKYYSATWAALKTDIISFVISSSDEFLSKSVSGPQKMIDDNETSLFNIQKIAIQVHGENHEVTGSLIQIKKEDVKHARDLISKDMLNYLNENDCVDIIFSKKPNPEWNEFCKLTKLLREGLVKYKSDKFSSVS